MTATPDEVPGVVITSSTRTPFASRLASSIGPNASSPTLPIMRTSAPSRAAATAWFAPLPPGRVAKLLPITVSPG